MERSGLVRGTPIQPRALVWLHWATLVPLCVAIAAVIARDQVEERSLRAALLWAHQCSGVAVMLLGSVRLLNRWQNGTSFQRHVASHRTRVAAAGTHALMYIAMFAVPMLGWALATASGRLVPYAPGLPGVPQDDDLAERIANWHGSAAAAWMVVIGLHATAALWHHYVLQDDVLRAMRLSGTARPPEPISADRSPPH